uniref:Uncharacterized protein n=1 Tax=Cucumis sativus TaxID=3659 RepID=A0A0A0LXE6_CUCSA
MEEELGDLVGILEGKRARPMEKPVWLREMLVELNRLKRKSREEMEEKRRRGKERRRNWSLNGAIGGEEDRGRGRGRGRGRKSNKRGRRNQVGLVGGKKVVFQILKSSSVVLKRKP